MSSSQHWETGSGGDLLPPFTWADRDAPHSLRVRYQSDRNFDRIAVGSASKPLWASAVLRLHRGLENKQQVRGGDELENDVFGIAIPGKGWIVHPSGWHDCPNISPSPTIATRCGSASWVSRDGE